MITETYLANQFSFGSGGIFEQDDATVWEGIARAATSPWNRKNRTLLHYRQKRIDPDSEWKGPRKYYRSIYGEYLQEAFWRRWLKEMGFHDNPNQEAGATR